MMWHHFWFWNWIGLASCAMCFLRQIVYSPFSFDNSIELETEPQSLDLTSEVPPPQGGALTAALVGPAFLASDTNGNIQATSWERGR